ncbi:MAG: hypothetical protein QNK23_11360 [Crocinitomicaceae bacterium]|nr:hypothetical protein [Crocinitomicaceae bacterium]
MSSVKNIVSLCLLLYSLGVTAQQDSLRKDRDTSTVEYHGYPIGTKQFDFAPIIRDDNILIGGRRRKPDPAPTLYILAKDSSTFSLDSLPNICLKNESGDTLWLAFENKTFCCLDLHVQFGEGGGFVIPYNYTFLFPPSRENTAIQLLPNDSLIFEPGTNANFDWTAEKEVTWYAKLWMPLIPCMADIWVTPMTIKYPEEYYSMTEPKFEAIYSDQPENIELEIKRPTVMIAELSTIPISSYPVKPWSGYLQSTKVVILYER